eukprot:CAMPEP_0168241986 /NCGR_PEP_ID=MMETSP0140_2-20121125/23136_1 /TAXON_ID=44445 /ORGANISM="Pseudo-nitzschia australis, Strain 10249 10 AB" /LENGTH=94 /DNA_ID=CAMNT_0008176971 /DNA_START=287 /DNA_END=568 /DNA_ORIENTATION=+
MMKNRVPVRVQYVAQTVTDKHERESVSKPAAAGEGQTPELGGTGRTQTRTTSKAAARATPGTLPTTSISSGGGSNNHRSTERNATQRNTTQHNT